jgi:hypothetical protein
MYMYWPVTASMVRILDQGAFTPEKAYAFDATIIHSSLPPPPPPPCMNFRAMCPQPCYDTNARFPPLQGAGNGWTMQLDRVALSSHDLDNSRSPSKISSSFLKAWTAPEFNPRLPKNSHGGVLIGRETAKAASAVEPQQI